MLGVPIPRSAITSERLVRPRWDDISVRDPGLLWLDKNENLDPEFLAFAKNVVAKVSMNTPAISIYPESGRLYHKLARHLDVNPANLRLTPGSDGAIRTVFDTFVNPGDTVVHTSPTFAMYPVYCEMFGAKAVAINYEATSKGPQLSLETLLAVVKKVSPKLVCLPNPDSPTGSVLSRPELVKLLECARERSTAVLIDEAYHPFYTESVIPLVNEYPNLIVARTFAKAWGLAGLRIGYAVAHQTVAEYLHKSRPMYEVNTLAVHVIEEMLNHVDAMENSVRRINEGKQKFLHKMQSLGFEVLNGEGNFLHVRFGNDAEKIHKELEKLVLYRKNFSDNCLSGYSRFSAAPWEIMAVVAERIAKVVN